MAQKLQIDNELGILTLVQGQVSEKQFWALLSLYPSKYDEYEEKIAHHEEFNITNYGRVIESGYGDMPPKEQQEFFTQKYGADYLHLEKEKAHAE
jgi:hypothetical protein